MLKSIIFLIAPIPSISFFCSLLSNRFYYLAAIRSNYKKLAKTIALYNSISSFLISFIGLFFYCCILLLRLPYCLNNNIDSPYVDFLNSVIPFSYAIIRIALFSFATALWGGMGLIGALLINPTSALIAIFVSFIASYICEDMFMQFPQTINIYYLTRGRGVNWGNSLINFLYVFILFSILIVLLNLFFVSLFRRKIKNE